MSFNLVFRTLFDSVNDPMNTLVRAEIGKLEAEARELKAQGKAPALELAEQVNDLRERIAKTRAQAIAMLQESQVETRKEWEKQRDKRPDLDLAQMRRAENRIKGITDQQALEMAIDYENGADLDLATVNELRARLRQSGEESAAVHLETLNDVAIQRRADMPWLEDPEASAMADYAGALGQLQGGQIYYSGSEGQAVFEIADLIDFDDEMNAPEHG